MTTILSFQPRHRVDKPPPEGHEADVILFPGIRYERWDASETRLGPKRLEERPGTAGPR